MPEDVLIALLILMGIVILYLNFRLGRVEEQLSLYEIKYAAVRAVKDIPLVVALTGVTTLRIRGWFGECLMSLGARVAGYDGVAGYVHLEHEISSHVTKNEETPE